MMKKTVVMAMCAAAAAAAFAEMKVGTVEMLMLVRNHPNYESNKSYLSEKEKDYSKKLDALKADIESVQEEGKSLADQARNPMLAQTEKAKLEKRMMDVQQRFVAAQQKLRSEMMRSQQELQEDEARLLKATTASLRKTINAYAEKNGYDFIFDSSAAPFAKKTYDVTPGVLKEMGVDPDKAVKPGDGDKKADGKKEK